MKSRRKSVKPGSARRRSGPRLGVKAAEKNPANGLSKRKHKTSAPLFVALVHHPVTNKRGDIVTTSLTTFDLHDIARSSITFGVKKYYVLTPLASQRKFGARITGLWQSQKGRLRNWTREEAFQLIDIRPTIKDAVADIRRKYGVKPLIVGTSAKAKNGTPVEALRHTIKTTARPILLLFGTGWGMTPEVLSTCDQVLEPIEGDSGYNHLSVRSAAAIYLHGLKGRKLR